MSIDLTHPYSPPHEIVLIVSILSFLGFAGCFFFRNLPTTLLSGMYWLRRRVQTEQNYIIVGREKSNKKYIPQELLSRNNLSDLLHQACRMHHVLAWSLIFAIKKVASECLLLKILASQMFQATRSNIEWIARAGASRVLPTAIHESETDWNCAQLVGARKLCFLVLNEHKMETSDLILGRLVDGATGRNRWGVVGHRAEIGLPQRLI